MYKLNQQRQLAVRIKISQYKKLLGQETIARLLNTSVVSVRHWELGHFIIRTSILEAVENWDEISAQVDPAGKIIFLIK